jgi:hypothetical protein
MAFHHNADNWRDKYKEICLDKELLKTWFSLNS